MSTKLISFKIHYSYSICFSSLWMWSLKTFSRRVRLEAFFTSCWGSSILGKFIVISSSVAIYGNGNRTIDETRTRSIFNSWLCVISNIYINHHVIRIFMFWLLLGIWFEFIYVRNTVWGCFSSGRMFSFLFFMRFHVKRVATLTTKSFESLWRVIHFHHTQPRCSFYSFWLRLMVKGNWTFLIQTRDKFLSLNRWIFNGSRLCFKRFLCEFDGLWCIRKEKNIIKISK